MIEDDLSFQIPNLIFVSTELGGPCKTLIIICLWKGLQISCPPVLGLDPDMIFVSTEIVQKPLLIFVPTELGRSDQTFFTVSYWESLEKSCSPVLSFNPDMIFVIAKAIQIPGLVLITSGSFANSHQPLISVCFWESLEISRSPILGFTMESWHNFQN